MAVYEKFNEFMEKYDNFIKVPVVYGGTLTLVGLGLFNTIHNASVGRNTAPKEPHHDSIADHPRGADHLSGLSDHQTIHCALGDSGDWTCNVS